PRPGPDITGEVRDTASREVPLAGACALEGQGVLAGGGFRGVVLRADHTRFLDLANRSCSGPRPSFSPPSSACSTSKMRSCVIVFDLAHLDIEDLIARRRK